MFCQFSVPLLSSQTMSTDMKCVLLRLVGNLCCHKETAKDVVQCSTRSLLHYIVVHAYARHKLYTVTAKEQALALRFVLILLNSSFFVQRHILYRECTVMANNVAVLLFLIFG